MSKLNDDEIRFLAEQLAQEIESLGGLERYYDTRFGEGAFKKDADRFVAGFVESNGTIQ